MKFFLSLFLVLSLLPASIAFGADATAAPAPTAPLRNYSSLSQIEGRSKLPASAFRFDDAGGNPEDDGAAENFQEALGLFQDGDYNGAASASEIILQNYSGTPWGGRAVFLAARSYGAAGDLNKASEFFQLSKEKLACLAGYADYLLATPMKKAGRYKEALELYLDAAKEARPVSVESVLQAGEICVLLGNYEQASDLLKRLLGENLAGGSAARADYLLTMALAGAGDSKGAIKYYRILWRDYPGLSFEPKARKRLRELNIKIPAFGVAERMARAESCMKYCMNEDALQAYNAAYRALDKKSKLRAEALLGEGECYFRLKDNKNAEKALRAALDRKLTADKASEAYLLLARMYFREGDIPKFSDTVGRLSEKYPHESSTANALYLLGTVLSQKGDYDGALAALEKLSGAFPAWSRMDEALWQTGWAQFKKKDYPAAQESFSKLYSDYPDSSLAPQALYWRAKALGEVGNGKDAEVVFVQLKATYPYSFYSLISGLPSRICSGDPGELRMPGPDEVEDDYVDEPPASPDARLQAVYELGEQGLCGLARKELRHDEGLFRSPEESEKITDAYHFIGEYKRPLELVSSSWRRHLSSERNLPEEALKTLFPLPDWDGIYLEAKGYGVDPWLISAVIREESHCAPDAVSPVGAVGLMQLMEGTADAMCRKMNVASPGGDGLKNCGFNIPIGSFYLRQLLKKHGGRLAFVLAEYNAGPGGLAKWKAKAGDMPDDYFIENIDYAETRGYVKKVLRNYFMYKKLYSPAP
jgi:soluble lytic murein transglycosylase